MVYILDKEQFFEVRWSGPNRKHYERLGYIYTKKGDFFTVPLEHLSNGSHVKVSLKCDYCGKELIREYRDYLKKHDFELGDCCHNCEYVKAQKTNLIKYGDKNATNTILVKEKIKSTNLLKYGYEYGLQSPEIKEKAKETMLKKYNVEKPLQLKEFKDKFKETSLEKYGKEYYIQTDECKDKIKNTCLNKYGVENVSQVEEIREKVNNSFYKNGTITTSKQQLAIFELLKSIYGNCELNYPCGRCSLDCMVEINGIKIDVEYDGWYWHKDTQEKDKRRNYYVMKQGYKILRIKGGCDIPTLIQLKESIDYLLKENKNYKEILLDWK